MGYEIKNLMSDTPAWTTAEAAGWVKDAAAGAVGVVDGLASFFQRLG